ncbi:hypothetical protein [Mycobacterium sp.]|uniref:hypothetical protein n=1 Tax=Mycobacterium sp. TaxID=1785 RepID=UPI002D934C6F|nr:hypothetical protein [Mycobacterium sp.]
MDSSAPPRDGVDGLDAMARRFDETMGRARARAAAMNRTADELARRKDAGQHRRRMLDDLALELGR